MTSLPSKNFMQIPSRSRLEVSYLAGNPGLPLRRSGDEEWVVFNFLYAGLNNSDWGQSEGDTFALSDGWDPWFALSSERCSGSLKQTWVSERFWNSPTRVWFWLVFLSKALDLLLKSAKTRVVVPNAVFLLIFTSLLGFPKLLQGYLTKSVKAIECSSFLITESGEEREVILQYPYNIQTTWNTYKPIYL